MERLTDAQEAELKSLAEIAEDEIDFSDIPDLPDELLDPSKAKRGLLYQPVKQEVTVVLDEYVIDWFKKTVPEEKARSEKINSLLMDYIREQKFPARK